MTLDLYDFGDGGGAAAKWQRQHRARKNRDAALKARRDLRAQEKADYKKRMKKWRALTKKAKAEGWVPLAWRLWTRISRAFRRGAEAPKATAQPIGTPTTEVLFFNQIRHKEPDKVEWSRWMDSCAGAHEELPDAMMCQDLKREVFAGKRAPMDLMGAINASIVQQAMAQGVVYQHRIVKRTSTHIEEVMDSDEDATHG